MSKNKKILLLKKRKEEWDVVQVKLRESMYVLYQIAKNHMVLKVQWLNICDSNTPM